jgi:hypothetical protein
MAYPGNVIAKMTYLDALLEGFPVHRAFGSPSRASQLPHAGAIRSNCVAESDPRCFWLLESGFALQARDLPGRLDSA